MKKQTEQPVEQPQPLTPGITRAMVRQHAYELYRDKWPGHPLTLSDWVMAENMPKQAAVRRGSHRSPNGRLPARGSREAHSNIHFRPSIPS